MVTGEIFCNNTLSNSKLHKLTMSCIMLLLGTHTYKIGDILVTIHTHILHYVFILPRAQTELHHVNNEQYQLVSRSIVVYFSSTSILHTSRRNWQMLRSTLSKLRSQCNVHKQNMKQYKYISVLYVYFSSALFTLLQVLHIVRLILFQIHFTKNVHYTTQG